jgi:hypothetical protein
MAGRFESSIGIDRERGPAFALLTFGLARQESGMSYVVYLAIIT